MSLLTRHRLPAPPHRPTTRTTVVLIWAASILAAAFCGALVTAAWDPARQPLPTPTAPAASASAAAEASDRTPLTFGLATVLVLLLAMHHKRKTLRRALVEYAIVALLVLLIAGGAHPWTRAITSHTAPTPNRPLAPPAVAVTAPAMASTRTGTAPPLPLVMAAAARSRSRTPAGAAPAPTCPPGGCPCMTSR